MTPVVHAIGVSFFSVFEHPFSIVLIPFITRRRFLASSKALGSPRYAGAPQRFTGRRARRVNLGTHPEGDGSTLKKENTYETHDRNTPHGLEWPTPLAGERCESLRVSW